MPLSAMGMTDRVARVRAHQMQDQVNFGRGAAILALQCFC